MTDSTKDAQEWGEIVYGPELAALNLIAPTSFTQASGPCPCLHMTLPDGGFLQVTDEQEPLAWHRSEHEGWAVAVHAGGDAGKQPVLRLASGEGSKAALVILVAQAITQAFVRSVTP